MKLEARGEIVLPVLRYRRKRKWACAGDGLKEVKAAEPVERALEALRPLSIEPVEAGSAEHRLWRFYLERHHYLKLRIVGENVGYLVQRRGGRDLACLLFGAAAWKCAARDRFLEWSGLERATRLSEVANNTRFLILPWVRVPHLASHVLGLAARRIDSDWQAKYGHGVRWLETFVERGRFLGTCYRAANWKCVGQTAGRSRQDREKKLRVPVKEFTCTGWRPDERARGPARWQTGAGESR